MQKKFWIFQNLIDFQGKFWKSSFWKMGMAGIKQLLHPSKIASFSGTLNEEALQKVSFKKIDQFQKYKVLKSKFSKKAQFHKENGIKK